ncbi:MAG: AtpZ/AtpI family protein [Lachnospiraceae bacterium]|nr:AtpZ/AtpI family protein [Lachnospiraceae bacterium]
MKSEKRKILFAISLVSQIGISMMVPIFLCVGIAVWLGEKLGKDYVVIIGILLGVIVAFRNVFYLTKRMYAKDLKQENERQKYYDDLYKERKKNLGK